MAAQGFLLIASYLLVLLMLARPLGSLLARDGERCSLPGLAGVERGPGAWPGSAPRRWAGCSILIAIVLF